MERCGCGPLSGAQHLSVQASPPCTRAAAHRPCGRSLVLPADPERRGGRSFLFVLRVVLARKGQASIAPWSPWCDRTDLVKEMNGSGVSAVMVKRDGVSRQVLGEGVSETGVSHCGRSHSCFSGLRPFG